MPSGASVSKSFAIHSAFPVHQVRVAIQKTDSCGFSTRSVVHATCAQYAMVTMSIAGLTAGRRRSHPRSETRRRPVKTCSWISSTLESA